MQFAAVTLAIVMGAIAERGRVLPAMVFTFIWTTVVYCPIAYWVWGFNGWAFKYGVLDYAGNYPFFPIFLLWHSIFFRVVGVQNSPRNIPCQGLIPATCGFPV